MEEHFVLPPMMMLDQECQIRTFLRKRKKKDLFTFLKYTKEKQPDSRLIFVAIHKSLE